MTLMTQDQYTELVGFLGRSFEERDHRMNALFEQARNELRLVAEGLTGRLDKVDGRLGSLERSFASFDEWVRRTLVDQQSRIQALE